MLGFHFSFIETKGITVNVASWQHGCPPSKVPVHSFCPFLDCFLETRWVLDVRVAETVPTRAYFHVLSGVCWGAETSHFQVVALTLPSSLLSTTDPG